MDQLNMVSEDSWKTHLSAQTDLQILHLDQTRLTSDALATCQSLKKLKYVRILRGSESLTDLLFYWTNVTHLNLDNMRNDLTFISILVTLPLPLKALSFEGWNLKDEGNN